MVSDSLFIEQIVNKLRLKPHIEGGFGGLYYQDSGKIIRESLPSCYNSERSYGNAIYFLLPAKTKSIFHRIKMNEIWHFYLGDPLELYHISPEGQLKKTVLGQDILADQKLVYVVPKMNWVGAIPMGNNFSLVGCSTSPGFTMDDWEKGEREDLLQDFPDLEEIILKLT